MNKNQRKILLTKILPIGLVLSVVVIGLISIPILEAYGESQHEEFDEWYSKPENRAKLNESIKSNSKTEKNYEISTFMIKDLSLNSEGWNINTDDRRERAGMVLFSRDSEFVNIMYSKEIDNQSLLNYSENQNEKIVRNLGNAGITLYLEKEYEEIILERQTIVHLYHSIQDEQKQKYIAVLCMKYRDYFYTISYSTGSKIVADFFFNLEFKN